MSTIRLAELVSDGAFPGETPRAREVQGQRWAQGLVALGQAEKTSGEWLIKDTARLPSQLTVEAFTHGCRKGDLLDGFRVPDGALEVWREKDRRRFLDTHELLRFVDERRKVLPTLNDQRFEAVIKTERGEWAKTRGLSCDLGTLAKYRRRVNPASGREFDGNIDSRGRRAATEEQKAKRRSPELWDTFLHLMHGENRLTAAEAHRIVGELAVEKHLNWPRALRTVQHWYQTEVPANVKTLYRRGERRFNADCLPKTHRDWSEIPAGYLWCGDERTLDVHARVPCPRRGWRPIRPKLTAWLDVRSRLFIGWKIDELANSDTILAAFQMGAETWGLPSEALIDNGEDYKAVGGSARSRKWDEFDTMRLGTVFEQSHIQVHYAIKYSAWSKPIESNFRTVKEGLDKHLWSYCGGRPDEKPEDLAKRIKDLQSLPTLDEIRKLFAEFLEAHHADAHSGEGMFGLSPNLVMERFRGPIRTCDRDTLTLLCSRMVGPVKVGRDGVRYRGVLYGNRSEELCRFYRRDVFLRINPARADYVTVCDEQGTPLLTATNERMTGATQEDVRKAAQHRAHVKRAARTFMDNRGFMLDGTPQQIMGLKRRAAQRAEAETRKALGPAPEPPGTTIVRPDLHAAVKKLKSPAAGRAVAAAAIDDPFGDLARRYAGEHGGEAPKGPTVAEFYGQLGRGPVEPAKAAEPDYDWATYFKEHAKEATGTDSSKGKPPANAGPQG